MGIVGLPNVGKSLTFNALSNLDVPSQNYSFCTKDPNLATVEIQDKKIDFLDKLYKPKKATYATIKIFDIAGLVKGASEGNGLGNEFLSHINAVDGLFHVVRAFDDECVAHEEGSVDPVRDLNIIHNELIQKDLEWCSKKKADFEKSISRNNDKEEKFKLVIVDKVIEALNAGKWVKDLEWGPNEIFYLNRWLFLTAKPVIYLLNCGSQDYIQK